ncbi:quinone reductase-like [Ostrea edulis]|uniref:quinone reductase-like n=1 Tax=Ostrea edulis TaxID=37623 RepID=UPI0020952C60|nr:quinone reductase-like [Ostrea edulis]
MYKQYIRNLTVQNEKAEMASSGKLKVLLILGSIRDGRQGLRVAKFMRRKLVERNFDVKFFDPVEMNFPMVTKPVHFFGPERTNAPKILVENEKFVKEADAYVLVSAEYNHNVPPALTNLLDAFPGSAYAYKPSGLVCYSMGPFGGMRAAMALRAITGELGCLSVSNIFGIPTVQHAFDEEGNPKNDHMESGAKKMLDQLEWMAHAMKNHRDKVGLPS